MRLKEKNKTVCPNNCNFFLDLLKSASISFWIDSSGGPEKHCNLSFYGSNPKYCLYGYLNEVYEMQTGNTAIRRYSENCFDFLEEKIKEEKHNKDGIFVGYFSYDLFQRSLKAQYPDFFFAYFPVIVRSVKGETIPKRYEIASSAHSVPPRNDILRSNMTDSEYLKKVKQIKEEIKAGNVYQVNLTRQYSINIDSVDELDLYLKLRSVSPNPYGCFFKTPFVTVLSSSPEEFIFVKDGYTRTRPIKGTLPKDIFKIDPKNQAENIMIVDLERNDLGRICEYGSVSTKSLLEIESYKHLNHVVSTVEGKLRNNVSLRQIFEALFPGGSITGAPKISAMKIIDRIEPTKRGAYTGSFGYIKTNGEMNFNILIRTIFVRNNVIARSVSDEAISKRYEIASPSARNDVLHISFNVGGGIVADSDPQSELEEIKLKAKGIMSALEIKC